MCPRALCDQKVTGSSHENSVLQKCKASLKTEREKKKEMYFPLRKYAIKVCQKAPLSRGPLWPSWYSIQLLLLVVSPKYRRIKNLPSPQSIIRFLQREKCDSSGVEEAINSGSSSPPPADQFPVIIEDEYEATDEEVPLKKPRTSAPLPETTTHPLESTTPHPGFGQDDFDHLFGEADTKNTANSVPPKNTSKFAHFPIPQRLSSLSRPPENHSTSWAKLVSFFSALRVNPNKLRTATLSLLEDTNFLSQPFGVASYLRPLISESDKYKMKEVSWNHSYWSGKVSSASSRKMRTLRLNWMPRKEKSYSLKKASDRKMRNFLAAVKKNFERDIEMSQDQVRQQTQIIEQLRAELGHTTRRYAKISAQQDQALAERDQACNDLEVEEARMVLKTEHITWNVRRFTLEQARDELSSLDKKIVEAKDLELKVFNRSCL
ncbi:hypothetical protein RND71_030831 [Anisodus tanguticus]|uniref:Uncharacterized protein n=1 Tax=Anisodus tanguticus TaxID=243964 RepID=A0AAE1V036_9SOLA|nr:hypothetical protein RND71_030831 [Anisodus tanguticus]